MTLMDPRNGILPADPEPANGCHCAKCWPRYPWFRVCKTCGNKRCPHAADHELTCTASNQPGQKGSLYENC